MRPRRLTFSTASVAIAVAATGIAGVGIGAAATKAPPTFKACATSKNVLTLANAKGGCARGTHAVTLNPKGATGPQGAQGVHGIQGIQGPKGDTGPAGTPNAAALHYFQAAAGSDQTFHPLATVDGVTISVACYNSGTTEYLTAEWANASTTRAVLYDEGVQQTSTMTGPAPIYGSFGNTSAAGPQSFLADPLNAVTTSSVSYVSLFITGAGGRGATMTGFLAMSRLNNGNFDCQVEGSFTDGPAVVTS